MGYSIDQDVSPDNSNVLVWFHHDNSLWTLLITTTKGDLSLIGGINSPISFGRNVRVSQAPD
ncbi:MAG: hypothetical protein ACYDBJ_09475 [Aggregatilineales bacterium]